MKIESFITILMEQYRLLELEVINMLNTLTRLVEGPSHNSQLSFIPSINQNPCQQSI